MWWHQAHGFEYWSTRESIWWTQTRHLEGTMMRRVLQQTSALFAVLTCTVIIWMCLNRHQSCKTHPCMIMVVRDSLLGFTLQAEQLFFFVDGLNPVELPWNTGAPSTLINVLVVTPRKINSSNRKKWWFGSDDFPLPEGPYSGVPC